MLFAMWRYVFLVVLSLLIVGCSTDHWRLLEQKKNLAQADVVSARYFKPLLQRQHAPYPPRQLALLIFKKSRQIQLYAQNQQRWHYVTRFPILAASGYLGPKLREGDHQVPEGIYHIVALNPLSNFDLSMQIDYPNSFDRHWGRLAGRKHLGENIFIHGGHRSIGCIAIGNPAIQKLYPLVAKVGVDHVEVIIAPNDLRLHQAVIRPQSPSWLPQLYANIGAALKAFPLVRA